MLFFECVEAAWQDEFGISLGVVEVVLELVEAEAGTTDAIDAKVVVTDCDVEGEAELVVAVSAILRSYSATTSMT